MFPIPELIVGKPSEVSWVYPHAVNPINLNQGNKVPYTTGAGLGIGNTDRPLYNKLWQASFDDTSYRAIWLNEASDPNNKTRLLDTNRLDSVGLSLTFSTRMQPCVAWWDRAATCFIYWFNDRTREYTHSKAKAEYPILLQSDIENMFYGHSHLILLCLIEGRLHYYHEMDGFTKPVPVLPDLLWYSLDRAGMAEGRRLGIIGEIYDHS